MGSTLTAWYIFLQALKSEKDIPYRNIDGNVLFHLFKDGYFFYFLLGIKIMKCPGHQVSFFLGGLSLHLNHLIA